MKRIHKFLRLPWTDRRLLVKSVFLLGTIRMGLWLLSFQTLRRLLTRRAQAKTASMRADLDTASSGSTGASPSQSKNSAPIDRVAWAVGVASRYVPKATCLVQALAAQVLLARGGHSACLRVGVALSEEGKLEAHAWVESQGKIVVGGSIGLSRYTPLPPLK